MGIKGSFTFISIPWQSKSVWHKRYSDYNSAAIMLDRTREKKKKVCGQYGSHGCILCYEVGSKQLTATHSLYLVIIIEGYSNVTRPNTGRSNGGDLGPPIAVGLKWRVARSALCVTQLPV